MFADQESAGELIAKIADFGYSATAASVKRGKEIGGTLPFEPPECTASVAADMKKYANKPTKDNYGFGLVVWQVAMDGETPYYGMNMDEIEKTKNSDPKLTRLIGLLPADTPEYFKTVIRSMTRYNPPERASLATVRQTMGLDDDTRYYLSCQRLLLWRILALMPEIQICDRA